MEVDPNMKMIFFVAPAIAMQILFPIFSLVVMTTYLREIVIIIIFLIISLTALTIWKYITQKEKDKLKKYSSLFIIDKLYKQNLVNQSEKGLKEFQNIKHTAILTSWISPCTVWCNNRMHRSYFLLISSLTVMAAHSIGLLGTYCFACFGDFTNILHPPVFHCFPMDGNVTGRLFITL